MDMKQSHSLFFTMALLLTSTWANSGFFKETYTHRNAPVFPNVEEIPFGPVKSGLSIVLNSTDSIAPILPTHFGNNTNAWLNSGWVDDSLAIKRLSDARISYLRLPGGNWSNIWFWDGIIPDDLKVDVIPNLNAQPGDGSSWVLSSDEMITMAQNIGAEAQICVNYSLARYGGGENPVADAAHYAAEWVRHVNGDLNAGVTYWEVGNENFGKWQAGYSVDGDTITGTHYGLDFQVFVDSMKAADPSIKIGAVIYNDDADGAGTTQWNAAVLPLVQEHADYLIVHEYFTWAPDINDVTVDEMIAGIPRIKEDMVAVHAMVEKYTDKSEGYFPVAMTEFNVRAGKKNEAHISGLLIPIMLGEFITSEYGLVNLWDVANGWSEDEGDHGMLSRKDTRVDDYTPHPTYFSYYYSTQFLGSYMISSGSNVGNELQWYASQFHDGPVGLIMVNTSPSSQNVDISIESGGVEQVHWFEVTAPNNDPESEIIAINGRAGTPVFGPDNFENIPPYYMDLKNLGHAQFEIKPWSVYYVLLSEKQESSNSDSFNQSSAMALSSDLAEVSSSRSSQELHDENVESSGSSVTGEVSPLYGVATSNFKSDTPVIVSAYSLFGERFYHSFHGVNMVSESLVPVLEKNLSAGAYVVVMEQEGVTQRFPLRVIH